MENKNSDLFALRHIGPRPDEIQEMLRALGYSSLDELARAVVPESIRLKTPLDLGEWSEPRSEVEALNQLRKIASRNQVRKSWIGMGYSNCRVPSVIQRNILENPGWYTQYTPYQSEIAQGRLEALLNFQTMIIDLTGLPVANASLLDEATAAAEAMNLARHSSLGSNAASSSPPRSTFLVSDRCHPQTIEVVQTRARPLGVQVKVVDLKEWSWDSSSFGALIQYPDTLGEVMDWSDWIAQAHANGTAVVMAADLLALTLLKSPGELGADIAIGNTQRFGVPLGYGGPHAAYLAVRDEFKRQMPGRIVGVSQDAEGKSALRLALQTREQHIRRDKATSNICTSQVLLAVMAGMYAVYHGPEGLKRIALQVNGLASTLKEGLGQLGFKSAVGPDFFDTICVEGGTQSGAVLERASAQGVNLRIVDPQRIAIALDETTTEEDIAQLLQIFAPGTPAKSMKTSMPSGIPASLERKSAFLAHPVFHRHRSETEMLRYMHRLETKDLALNTSMIPLGSCTMKLNATSEMLPVSWPEFSSLHPFAPLEQAGGYRELFLGLETMLARITGMDAVSLQPNAGSQGEYAGLLAIQAYHSSRNQKHRNVCLIPKSAHGTNPASAALAGLKVVVVECDARGNIDLQDLRAKAVEHREALASLMITYPSTHGVFEETVIEVCKLIHENGGQVYLDGANLNAQVGLCRPGDLGADVCHLNLHKTFCIPHGGGGPGMGPIAVKAHLEPFLPSHLVTRVNRVGARASEPAAGAVSAAPWGSASILPISWMYIAMMGAEGLKRATQVAILNANFIAKRLEPHYPILYRGSSGLIAHECIFDLRPLKASAGVEVEDVAKRLMDYGFHAPTVSFPVAGTMMVEPTESESLDEINRFCEAMIAIRGEIAEVEAGRADRQNNLLKRAPHTVGQVSADAWDRPYSRAQAAFPLAWVRERKFWPAVARINNVLGDRQLVCACPSTEDWV